MGFDSEIDSGLVICVGWQTSMDRVAVDQEGKTALLGEGTHLALSENGMRCVQENVLELSRPGLVSIVENLDAPDLAVFQRFTDRLVDFPMRHLTVSGLAGYIYSGGQCITREEGLHNTLL